jgi:hypothetical protein
LQHFEGVKALSRSAMRYQSPSGERSPAFRSRALSLAHAGLDCEMHDAGEFALGEQRDAVAILEVEACGS